METRQKNLMYVEEKASFPPSDFLLFWSWESRLEKCTRSPELFVEAALARGKILENVTMFIPED